MNREPVVRVVGLGPGGPDLVTAGTLDAIAATTHRFLRTRRHPAASVAEPAVSFDSIYEAEADLEAVYARIVDELVGAATEHGEVLYLVPGSPFVAERTVELLLGDARVDVEAMPALSFLDLVWSTLGVGPMGVHIVDGQRFAVEAAGQAGPLVVCQCDSLTVLSDIKLAVDGDALGPVLALQRLGLPDQSVTEVAWDDLDRIVEPDHLTTLYIPRLGAPVASELVRFDELVHRLRRECPWDAKQTHQSLTRHMIEEAYEAVEAMESLPSAEGYEHLEEELGDVLFQVVFHATLAAEEGQFTLADVARRVHDKLVHRHPHVFAQVRADTAEEVLSNWEQIKKAEKGRSSVMEGIPAGLPALLYAAKVQRKAESLGVEPMWAEGVGQELFDLVRRARADDVDPEAALRSVANNLRDRVVRAEHDEIDQIGELGLQGHPKSPKAY